MILEYDKLIDILAEKCDMKNDTPPNRAFYIQFACDKRVYKETITFETAAGTEIVMDIDKDGRVLGLEIT
ncbi:MAG: DUF2283 domain-containing protein [Acidobacteriota bacterium]